MHSWYEVEMDLTSVRDYVALGRLVGRFAVLARFKMPGKTERDWRTPQVYVQSSDGNLLSGGWKDIFTAVLLSHSPGLCVWWMHFLGADALSIWYCYEGGKFFSVFSQFFWFPCLRSGIAYRLLLGELTERTAHGIHCHLHSAINSVYIILSSLPKTFVDTE